LTEPRRNVELKARDAHPARSLTTCGALGAKAEGILVQRDTYFNAPRGRLKLREEQGAAARLIAYERADLSDQRTSHYRLIDVGEPEALRAALATTLGIKVVVTKERRYCDLMLANNAREGTEPGNEQRERLEQQLGFIPELDKLKSVLRQTLLSDGSRRENDAEHSWELAVMAVVLAEHAGASIDLPRVVRMLLIHDIVEIDAGDTFLYDEGRRRPRQSARSARPSGSSASCPLTRRRSCASCGWSSRR
jgi:hypothetical protein